MDGQYHGSHGEEGGWRRILSALTWLFKFSCVGVDSSSARRLYKFLSTLVDELTIQIASAPVTIGKAWSLLNL